MECYAFEGKHIFIVLSEMLRFHCIVLNRIVHFYCIIACIMLRFACCVTLYQVKYFHLLLGALNKRTDAKQMVSTILLVSKKQHDTQTLHAVHKCNTTDEGRRKVKENAMNLKKMPQNVSLKKKISY